MGNTYEVHGYRMFDTGEYDYELIYAGESKQDALRALWEADKDFYGCVKLEWR